MCVLSQADVIQQGEASGEEGRVGKQPLGRRGEGQRKGRSRRLRPCRPKATGLHPAEKEEAALGDRRCQTRAHPNEGVQRKE